MKVGIVRRYHPSIQHTSCLKTKVFNVDIPKNEGSVYICVKCGIVWKGKRHWNELLHLGYLDEP